MPQDPGDRARPWAAVEDSFGGTPPPGSTYAPAQVGLLVHLTELEQGIALVVGLRQELQSTIRELEALDRQGLLSARQARSLDDAVARLSKTDDFIVNAEVELADGRGVVSVMNKLRLGLWAVTYQGDSYWLVDTGTSVWSFDESWTAPRRLP